MRKIRCTECGAIIAHENEPISDHGEISIMCNNRRRDGKRCKTVNVIVGPERTAIEFESTGNAEIQIS